jgi:hypothetical protein
LRKILIVGALFIVLIVQPLARADGSEKASVYSITMNYEFQNTGPGQAKNVNARIYLFDNISGWANQLVLSEQIYLDETQIFPTISRTEDNRWTTIPIGDMSEGSSKIISITQTLKVSAVEFDINPNAVGTYFPPEVQKYTSPVPGLFESDDPAIQTLANQIVGNETNPYLKARQILENVIAYLRYERQNEEHGALWAYNNKKGDCTEFSNLFIALARAAGIPAKAISGFGYLSLYGLESASTDVTEIGHAWAIAYLPNYGWVPVDAVWPRDIGSFGKLDYDHIVAAATGGDGVVKDGQIKWPGAGLTSYTWEYVGAKPTVNWMWRGQITPEVLIEPTLSAESSVQGDILKFYVTVKNSGQQNVNNLQVELSADNKYFEVPPAQNISSLAAGNNKVLTFDVKVKGSVENSVVIARVIYDSSYGTFLAEGQRTVNVAVVAPLGGELNVMLFVLIGVTIGLVAGIAIVLLRR